MNKLAGALAAGAAAAMLVVVAVIALNHAGGGSSASPYANGKTYIVKGWGREGTTAKLIMSAHTACVDIMYAPVSRLSRVTRATCPLVVARRRTPSG